MNNIMGMEPFFYNSSYLWCLQHVPRTILGKWSDPWSFVSDAAHTGEKITSKNKSFKIKFYSHILCTGFVNMKQYGNICKKYWLTNNPLRNNLPRCIDWTLCSPSAVSWDSAFYADHKGPKLLGNVQVLHQQVFLKFRPPTPPKSLT